MPEPLKNLFNRKLIGSMGENFAKAWPAFDRRAFVQLAANNLAALELKERSAQITDAMPECLPDDFERAAAIVLASLAPVEDGDDGGAEVNSQGLAGWAIMPMTRYVGLHGLDHFELSMSLFKEMTKRFTAETDIRYFLLACPEATLSVLQTWTGDPDRHVRRLVSEGTRPRLPWAMQLPAFITDPAPILPLLEALKDDEAEYVRRSVANSLNDIAKDHPDLVARIAKRWLQGAGEARKRLVRHGCRTLLKQGHQGTLKALGYGPPLVELEKLGLSTARVNFGDALAFEICLNSVADRPQPLIVDYVIHHRKANGGTTAKVFKWKTLTLAPGATLRANRKHAIRQISTRVYYPGRHRLEVLVNGVSLGGADFDLIM